MLHEWDFLWIGEELYFVLGLFGVEYAMNFVSRDVDRYAAWLVQHSGDSPLYPSGLRFSRLSKICMNACIDIVMT